MADEPNYGFSVAFIDAVMFQAEGNIDECRKALLIASINAKTDREQNKIADFVKKYPGIMS